MKQKSKYGMPPPVSRAEYEHNMFLLLDELDTHQDDEALISNRLWALRDSLEQARYLPNGRIDLQTIDEKIRIVANLLDWMKYM